MICSFQKWLDDDGNERRRKGYVQIEGKEEERPEEEERVANFLLGEGEDDEEEAGPSVAHGCG